MLSFDEFAVTGVHLKVVPPSHVVPRHISRLADLVVSSRGSNGVEM
jgi:hypothetical protein